MKKKSKTVLFLLITLLLVTACSNHKENPEKISVVCTAFPQYDWVKQILGENNQNMDVTWLLDNGIDLHNYQPSAEEIIKISSCDVFIYVGGESDKWVNDVLKSAANPNIKKINLLNILGDQTKEEEFVEGMENDYQGKAELDEHVWLSLKNAEIFCEKIAVILAQTDADNEMLYQVNAKNYIAQLKELDKKYENVVENASRDTLLFADRFPFSYLFHDYKLEYFAAFVGCSAETEASFETIAFLADKLDAMKLPDVLVIEGSDRSLANTVIQTTKKKNQKILVLDSMQAVTRDDFIKGVTYQLVMQKNLDVINEALN